MTHAESLAQRLDPVVQPNGNHDMLRVIAVGTSHAVTQHVNRMYQLGYAQIHEWSAPMPTVNANEVMRILTKRIPR